MNNLLPQNDIDFQNKEQYDYLLNFLGMLLNEKSLLLLNQLNKKANKLDIKTLLHIKSYISDQITDPNVKLICFCGSHISDYHRFHKLKNMLVSWNKNLFKIKMILSISYESCAQLKDINNELSSLMDLYNRDQEMIFLINNGTEKISQFEHFQIISKRYAEMCQNYWIIFTDDDDIWSNCRTRPFNVMVQIAEKIIKINPSQKPSYLIYPYLCESSNYYASTDKIVSALCENEITIKSDANEYISFCVPFPIFLNFIKKSSPDLLKNSLCDVYLVKYLTTPSDSINFLQLNVPFWGWSYYYYNSRFLNKKSALVENDKKLIEMIKLNIIAYYGFYRNDSNFRNYHSKLIKIGNKNNNLINMYMKKAWELKDDEYFLPFKDSPVLL